MLSSSLHLPPINKNEREKNVQRDAPATRAERATPSVMANINWSVGMKTKAACATAAILVCVGCAGANGPSPELGPQPPLPAAKMRQTGAARSDLLTATELRELHPLTTFDGVRRLRPEFIRPSVAVVGNEATRVTPSVFLNGIYAGGLDVLETIPLDAVEEIRYLRPSRAYDLWGLSCRCNGGAIEVKTKRSN